MHGNSPVHYAKGTPSGIPAEAGIALRPLVGTRFQVLFHSPYRGSFHSSLTLLCAIGRRVVLSLGRWSSQIRGGFHVTAGTRETKREGQSFRIPDCHRLWSNFPDRSARPVLCHSRADWQLRTFVSHDPVDATVATLHANSLGSFPFARRY